jgi:hypothetical protein
MLEEATFQLMVAFANVLLEFNLEELSSCLKAEEHLSVRQQSHSVGHSS